MIVRRLLELWVAVIVLGGLVGWALVKTQNVQSHQNDALSAILCHAEHIIKTEPRAAITDKQRQQALRFYEQQIQEEHLKPCSTP